LKKIVNRKDVKVLLGTDKIFAYIHSEYGLPPNWSRPPGFTSLSRIILEQQISLASANAHFIRLKSYIRDFTPSNILRLTEDEMRLCQISRQKSKYLRELSSAALAGVLDLENLSKLNEDEARKQLTNIKGIGDWTADIYLMFCLQSKDIFPTGDIALVKAVKELCHVETKAEVAKISEGWKPCRSLAAYYLWHYYLCKKL
jgi:DNA-3-methyladenine glycosylase II